MSNAVDWSKAPEGAEFYAYGCFRKDGEVWNGCLWLYGISRVEASASSDYQPRPTPQEKTMKYEYGVEYPTNGVKPDLPDDVEIKWRPTECDAHGWRFTTAGALLWVEGHTKHKTFKIVDQRYKPSELVESANKYDRTITGKYGTGKCTIDVYRVLAAYDVTDSEVAHAVKKLLAPGQRGVKEERQDIEEAIQSLQAWIARMDDEGAK